MCCLFGGFYFYFSLPPPFIIDLIRLETRLVTASSSSSQLLCFSLILSVSKGASGTASPVCGRNPKYHATDADHSCEFLSPPSRMDEDSRRFRQQPRIFAQSLDSIYIRRRRPTRAERAGLPASYPLSSQLKKKTKIIHEFKPTVSSSCFFRSAVVVVCSRYAWERALVSESD